MKCSYNKITPSDIQHVFRDIEENGHNSLLGFEWSEWKDRGYEALIASIKKTEKLIINTIQEDVQEAKKKGFEIRPIIVVFGQNGDFTDEQEEAIFENGGIFHDRGDDTRDGSVIVSELVMSANGIHLKDCCGGSCGCGAGKCDS